jgi:hypothetical protein
MASEAGEGMTNVMSSNPTASVTPPPKGREMVIRSNAASPMMPK